MRYSTVLPVALAVGGLAAIVVGVHQGLVHVAPGYEGTIVTGWGGRLNRSERLLAGVGAVGVVGTVATLRWRRAAVVPIAGGGVVLFYALRAVYWHVRNTTLYAETTMYDGDPVVFVLGAEPFLLVVGGLLLVAAGVLGWRRLGRGHDQPTAGTPPSTV
ncbi:hypothetical protein [Haloarcula litorea]|uniref:hypothetical protein n=1 Tax=Haloarcula litorea TaxID=3032579 RepID=UPI0023E8B5B8|nr:hypothetical protein [Halomicroarcula sp. GDY20]